MGGKRITRTDDDVHGSVQCNVKTGAYNIVSVNVSTNGEHGLVRLHSAKTNDKGANASSPVGFGGKVGDLIRMLETIIKRLRGE